MFEKIIIFFFMAGSYNKKTSKFQKIYIFVVVVKAGFLMLKMLMQSELFENHFFEVYTNLKTAGMSL